MKVLLDTCIISEIRHPQGNANVKAAVDSWAQENLFLSAITVRELKKGIHSLPSGKQRRDLSSWLTQLCAMYTDRILDVTTETALIWGEITAQAQRDGKTVAAMDGLIAATAIQNGLHVVTRNTDDFQPTGALILNPWDD